MSIAPEAVREELDGEIRRIDLMLLGGGILYEREGAFICSLCRARPEELLSATSQLAQEGHVLRSGMRDRRTRRCCMRFRCEVRVPLAPTMAQKLMAPLAARARSRGHDAPHASRPGVTGDLG